MRIVIDTNVVASAVFFGGRPRDLLELLMRRELDAYISKEILNEYQETIEFLRNKYPAKKVNIPLTQIAAACKMIEPRTIVRVCRDPDDDIFISCAVDSHSLYIVSGDKDLLAVGQFDDIQIVMVADFFAYKWHSSF